MHVNYRGAKALRKVGINPWDEPAFGHCSSFNLIGVSEEDIVPFTHTDFAHSYSIDRHEYFELMYEKVKQVDAITVHFNKEFDEINFEEAILTFGNEKI